MSERVGEVEGSVRTVRRTSRLHEAARRIAESPDQSWADVAADLGYFDQAHFTREFTRVIGQPPGAYASACAKTRRPLAV